MKKYKIPSYYPAPEREYIILSIQEFIAAYNKYLSKSVEPNFDLVFQQWFDSEYRYNDIPQGEEFYGQSTDIDIEYPDGTTKHFKIPVVGKSREEEESDLVKNMNDYDILMECHMEWTGGTWNTFSIKLEDDEEFNPKKIKAIGKYGLIIDYTYTGEYLFESEDDYELTDGYISVFSSIFYNGSIHKINLEDLRSNLEAKEVPMVPDRVLNYLIDDIKNQE